MESSSASFLHLDVDDTSSAPDFDVGDTSLSSLIHHDSDDHEAEIYLHPTMISDAKYAEELQFQEVIMSSTALISQTTNNIASCFSSTLTTQATNNIASCSSSTLTTQATQAVPTSATHEVLDPESQTLCGICVEVKEKEQMFSNQSCAHSFCSDCITKQVAAKLEGSIHFVCCPGLDCKAALTLEDCTPILPKMVLERWNDALFEALVLGSQKLYCPFSDCSMVLVIDNEGEGVRESECPACHRLFCAGCRVPWHSGVDCDEFLRLNEDERGREDLMVNQLAKEKMWKRCPRCKFYVEKTEGCLHITCRCHFEFCYSCGAEWTSNHGGCQSQCIRN